MPQQICRYVRPGGAVDGHSGCAAIQRDLDQLEIWSAGTSWSSVKGNAESCPRRTTFYTRTCWMPGKQLCRKPSGDLGGQQAHREWAKHLAVKKTTVILGCMRQTVASTLGEVISSSEAHPKHWDQFWASQNKRDKDLLEVVEQRTMEITKGLEQGCSSCCSAWRRNGSGGTCLCL